MARSVRRTPPMNHGLLFGMLGLICFSAFFNFIVSSSWYNNSTIKTSQDDSGPPSVSDSQRLRFLSKEIETMKNEQTRFREEIIGQVHALEEKMHRGKHQKGSSLKVHLWDDTTLPNGYREKKLYSLEGFSTHPRTTLVDSPEDADIIAWVSVRGNTEKEIPPKNYPNVVLLDYADGCSIHQKLETLKHMVGYFKRSFVSRDQDSVYATNCTSDKVKGGIFPFAYSGLEALVNNDIHKERNTLITSVLRTEGLHNKVRSRIVDWTKAFIEEHELQKKTNIGDVGNGYSASDFDSKYLAHLADSKIIVTCNPYSWEGDFRLWEALLSGALVMVDKMAIPQWMPHPLVHKKHLVFYDTRNQSEFNSLLKYYIEHEDEARRIGEAGYNFVLEHHMAKDRVSYILDKIESRLVLD